MRWRAVIASFLVRVLVLGSVAGASAQGESNGAPPWTDVRRDKGADAAAMRLDVDALRTSLRRAPRETSPGVEPAGGRVLALPDRSGAVERDRIYEAPILADEQQRPAQRQPGEHRRGDR